MVIKLPEDPSSSIVIVSRYVPSLIYKISPAVNWLIACSSVSKGAAKEVPALLLLPPDAEGAT